MEEAPVFSFNHNLSVFLLLSGLELPNLVIHSPSRLLVHSVDLGPDVADLAKHHQLLLVKQTLANVSLGGNMPTFVESQHFHTFLVLVGNSNPVRHFKIILTKQLINQNEGFWGFG
ncbi:MAG: hypothetical protein ACKO96_07940, partial [Flammeovirgaceae bacterium]